MLAPTELAEAELTQRFAVPSGIGSFSEARHERQKRRNFLKAKK